MPSIGYYSGSSSFYLDESGSGSYIELDLNIKKNINLEEENNSKDFLMSLSLYLCPLYLA